MRSGNIPFRFDVTDLLARARRQFNKRVGNVTLSLPFISIAVSPKDHERQVAREILIRLKDRRVLSSWECCDDCIERALVSLQEIRSLLVDKQVELADCHDGPLYLLIDTMLSGIRQFLTFEETLKQDADTRPQPLAREPHDARQDYFDGLELLRSHLSHCLGPVATLARVKVPRKACCLTIKTLGHPMRICRRHRGKVTDDLVRSRTVSSASSCGMRSWRIRVTFSAISLLLGRRYLSGMVNPSEADCE